MRISPMLLCAGRLLVLYGLVVIFFACPPADSTQTGGVIQYSFERPEARVLNPNLLLSTVDSIAGDSGEDGLTSL